MDLNFILQNTVGNLYWKDKIGRYLGANQVFISLAGLKHHDEIVGKTDRELFFSVMSNEKLVLLEETDRRILSRCREIVFISVSNYYAGLLLF